MPQYLFSFRTPVDDVPTPDGRAAWEAFFSAISTHLDDIGNPIFTRASVGAVGTDTALGGYSIVHADDLDQARRLAADCPLIPRGGVEIGEITPLTTMQPATAMDEGAARRPGDG